MVKVAVLGASGQIGQPLSLLLKSVHPSLIIGQKNVIKLLTPVLRVLL